MSYSLDPQIDPEGRRLPTPRMMEAFQAVMEAGSVSAAARYLGVSQPAVSRLLKQFEEELGFSLFHRAKGKLTPTPEAHRLAIDVGQALDGIDRVRRSAEDVRRHGTGRLRIGVTPMLYEAVLHRLLDGFLSEHPHLVLTMETGLTEMMIDWLLRDQVELAFASLLESHPGIDAIPLIETHSVVLMPPDHPLTAKHAIGVEDLAEVPLITMTRRYPSRHRIEQMFRRAGVPMRLRAETNLSGTICDLVRLGQGVAILNALSWGGAGRGDLAARPLTPRLVNRYGVLHLADRGFSRPAQQLIAALRAHLGQAMGNVYLGEG
ncbi:LysR family transcriptional regulator [Pelagibius marinus]|uniref:LysR family transcriptional regulator n=1 Tax=Pelagibius marinus TaxID=2762760 RepID=UPI001872C995|nr:LysR family transcriptional regulator [Pelagibius marinus]